MLRYLRVRELGLIEELELELGPGLTVLTGETGAGKSMVVGAVELLSGGRASGELVRTGAEEAVVEAIFDVGPELEQWLAAQGLEAEGGQLVVRRVVGSGGRGRVQINGVLTTVGVLRQLGPRLVGVVGQDAAWSLTRAGVQLDLVEAFGELEGLAGQVREAYEELVQLDGEIEALERARAERERERARVEELIRELGELAPGEGEYEALKAEQALLASAARRAELAGAAYEALYASEGAASEALGRGVELLRELGRLDEAAGELAREAQGLYYQLEELARAVDAYAQGIVHEPERLEWVEGRLAAMERMARREGVAPQELAGLAKALEARLGELDGQDLSLEELRARRAQALEEALGLAGRLSRARTEAASRLKDVVEAQLEEVGMAGCEIIPCFCPPRNGIPTPKGPLGPRGLEEMELFIRTNPGEEPRALGRIASGGERSRLLMVLMAAVARQVGTPTVVFDEIDAGIGGRVAMAVGRRLSQLGRVCQVICITHSPQIAVWADSHLAVVKTDRRGRRITTVERLDEEGRLRELERMLGGTEGASARAHALELMRAARP